MHLKAISGKNNTLYLNIHSPEICQYGPAECVRFDEELLERPKDMLAFINEHVVQELPEQTDERRPTFPTNSRPY